MTVELRRDQHMTSEDAARRLVERVKARPTEGLEEAERWLGSDDPAEVVAARWARGAAYFELGRNDEALTEFGLAIAEGPDELNDWVAISMAAAESAAAKLDIAVERLTSLMQSDRRLVTWFAMSQLGLIRLHQGRLEECRVLLEESADGLRTFPEERVALARVLGNAGYCGLLLGRVRSAEQYFAEAMTIALETDQRLMAVGLDHNLGYVRMCLGDLPVAIAAYRRAIETYREIGGPGRNIVALYDDLAEAYRFAGLTRDAVRYARLSVWTARQGSNVEDLADSLYRYAVCLYHHGSHSAAAAAAGQSFELFEQGGRELWAARADLVSAAAAARSAAVTGSADDPATRLSTIARRLDELGSHMEATTARNLAARLLIDSGDPAGARAVLTGPRPVDAEDRRTEHTMEQFERLYAGALLTMLDDEPLDDVLDEARTRLNDLLRGMADAELRSGVTRMSSRFRSLALGSALEGQPDPWSLVEVENTWRFTLSSITGQLNGGDQDDDLSKNLGLLRLLQRRRRDEDELDQELDQRIGELEAEIRELSMAMSAAEARDVATPESVASVFEDWLFATGGRLLQLFEHDGLVHAVSIGDGSAVHRSLPTEDLEARLSTIRSTMGRLLRAHSSSPTAGVLWEALRSDTRRLGAELLGGSVPGRPIVVSAPPGFAPLPWSMLVDESNPISVVPAASVWCSDPHGVPLDDVAVVIGPDLEHAAVDGSSVTAAVPAANLFDGRAATRDRLLGLLGSNTVVHVAAHSRYRPDSVMFSSLQMADGEVPVYDVARLVRVPRLVVLAACEAGETGGNDFGEWLGLVPELLRRGADCLVAPIRPIADSDAAAVMSRFYRVLRMDSSVSVAAALAQTRLELADENYRVRAAAHAFLAFGRGNTTVG